MNWEHFANPATWQPPDWCKPEYDYAGHRVILIGQRRQRHSVHRWGYYNVGVVRYLNEQNRPTAEAVVPMGRFNTKARPTSRFLAWTGSVYVVCMPPRAPNPRRKKPVERELHFAGYTFTASPEGTRIHREMVRLTPPGQDYGADPLGDGTFRMVPSGDIVDFEERNRRLAHLRHKR